VAGALRAVPCPGLGRTVVLPERPERIVSLAPALTDAVVRIRGVEALVGRSAWCWRPERVCQLPVVGGYTECRRDRLEALAPDLVLTTGGVQEPLARELAGEGWPVYLVPLPSSPWGIVENVTVVGTVTGEPDRALALARRCHEALGAVRDVLPPLRTWVEIDLGEPVTVGLGAFATWTLRWTGLAPTGWDEPRAYVTGRPVGDGIDPPELILWDAQPRSGATEAAVRERLRQEGVGHWLDAGARVIVTGGDVLAHSGPGLLLEGLPELVGAIRRLA